MEHRRFDALTRFFAHLIDRREGLFAALSLSLVSLLNGDQAMAKKKGVKGKGKGHAGGKKKNKNKRKKGGGGAAARDCNAIPLQPGADLHECDLRQHPGLASANFTDAKLEDTILSGANLTGVSFRGARLWRAKLDGALLTNAAFTDSAKGRTDIFGVDFSNANLSGATLDLETVLYARYAIFCNATMPNGDVADGDCG